MKKLLVAVIVCISSLSMFSCGSYGYHSSGSGCYVSYEDNNQPKNKMTPTTYTAIPKETIVEESTTESCR